MESKTAFTLGFLIVLLVSGCSSVDGELREADAKRRIDVFVLVTDRATGDEVRDRLQGVENLPVPEASHETWFQGHLTGMRDGSVYSIVVGQVGGEDDTNARTLMRKARSILQPRYVLIIGTAPAVAYDEPLGAVGVVTLVCDFDLERYALHGSTFDVERVGGDRGGGNDSSGLLSSSSHEAGDAIRRPGSRPGFRRGRNDALR